MISLIDLDREAVRRWGLAEFVTLAWPLVERSAPLVWSWHLDRLCQALERVSRRELRDLVVNIPPGCSKSLIVSVLWPAWHWAHDPGHRWIAASYSDKVVLRDAERMRTLIKSEWYRARWPGVEIPSGKAQSDAVSVYRTTSGGMRYSTTVPGGQLTGEHCDTMVVDDPIDPLSADAMSGLALDAVIAWWDGKASTRFRDHRRSARVLIMQRVHERDLAAHMIAQGAEVLCLPMRFDANHPHRSPLDPRTDGELLVPERIPETELIKLEARLGPTRTAAQLQQRPSPAGGTIFQRGWVRRYWTVLPPGGVWSQSWDLAFKAKADSDFVCGQVWYTLGATHYLVDMVHERLGFAATCAAIQAMSQRYPRAVKKRIEDKANGPAVMEALRSSVPGIEAVEPVGGKIARAYAAEPFFAAGNVLLPHPTLAEYEDGRRGAPWVRGVGVSIDAPEAAQGSYEHAMVSFPFASHDDAVDATTQHLCAATNSYVERLRTLTKGMSR